MKVAVCIPSRDTVHAKFAMDLAILCANWTNKGHDISLNHCEGTIIPDLRMNLAKEAIRQNADWTFWLDSDMRFPRDALDRLLQHGKDVVGTNYVTKEIPPFPTAHNFKDGDTSKLADFVYTNDTQTGLQEVDYLGFGCVLIKTEVFQNLDMPWFHVGFSNINYKFIGEDVYFCLKAKAKGIPIFIDHDLSKEIKHIGSFEYRHEHVQLEGAANGN